MAAPCMYRGPMLNCIHTTLTATAPDLHEYIQRQMNNNYHCHMWSFWLLS